MWNAVRLVLWPMRHRRQRDRVLLLGRLRGRWDLLWRLREVPVRREPEVRREPKFLQRQLWDAERNQLLLLRHDMRKQWRLLSRPDPLWLSVIAAVSAHLDKVTITCSYP